MVSALAVQAELEGASVPEVTSGRQRGLVLELASDSGTGAGLEDEEHLG